MTNIFDLSDINDIPSDIKKELNSDEFGKNILELFSLANRPLNIDEITVGYYRTYGVSDIKTKKQLTAKLYKMSKDDTNKLESVSGKKGVYVLKDSIVV